MTDNGPDIDIDIAEVDALCKTIMERARNDLRG
jgi:hypothetical protein